MRFSHHTLRSAGLGLLLASALPFSAAQDWTPASAGRVGYADAPVWAEEFSVPFDTSRWTAENVAWPHNGELQAYSADGKYVHTENGELVLTATTEPSFGRDFTSARVSTLGSATFKHGLFAARIKMPEGQGIWPAFWLFGTGAKYSELDIAEIVGGTSATTNPPTGYGNDRACASLSHYSEGDYDYANIKNGPGNSHHLPGDAKFSEGYHVFWSEWTETEVWTGVDSEDQQQMFADVSQYAAFQAPMYIILNIAVGGGFPGAPDASTVFPQTMHVDWVRVYARNGENVVNNLQAPSTASWVPESAARYGYGAPVWSDEFTGATLDPAKWTREVGDSTRDGELQFYSADPKYAQVSNGELVLTAAADLNNDRAYTSARLTTQHSASFTHGLFSVRAKLPLQQGVRAMVALMGLGQLWSEAVIVALKGDQFSPPNSGGTTAYDTHISFQMPSDASINPDHPGTQFPTADGRQWSEEYHVFWFEWTPHEVWAGVDSHERKMIVSDIANLPSFTAEMYLALDLSVGGTQAGAPDATTALPATMHIDWIRVYALNGENILHPVRATPPAVGSSTGAANPPPTGGPSTDTAQSTSTGSASSADEPISLASSATPRSLLFSFALSSISTVAAAAFFG